MAAEQPDAINAQRNAKLREAARNGE